MRLGRMLAVSALMAPVMSVSVASAKEVTVTVDARSGPWHTGLNPKLAYGVADARPAKIVWDATLRPGVTLKFRATGNTVTVAGGQPWGPDGQPDWTTDRGMAYFPSRHMNVKGRLIHLNELVGAFVDADGKVVGKPFPIGAAAEVVVPEGAAAISLGINDDRYSDNSGALTVTVTIPEASVTVEPAGGS